MPLSLGDIAIRFGCELTGDPDRVVSGVGTLAGAGPDDVTFLANRSYRAALASTRAAAVLLKPADAAAAKTAVLATDNPYATYARVAQLLHPPPPWDPGIHSSAVVAADAEVAATAWVGPQVVVEAGARVGADVYLGPGCLIGAGAVLGQGTHLVANVTVLHEAVIGQRCLLHPGAVIGADGFGVAAEDGEWVKVPQLGSVRIGDDAEIGANSAVDRGAIEDTIIGDGVKLDNHIQIGHNVTVGDHTVMAARAGVAGSTIIGRRCVIAADAGFVGHLQIADDVVITARSMITHSIKQAGTYGGGLPATELRHWQKNAARFRTLDALARRLMDLEKVIRSLRRGGAGEGEHNG